MNRHAQRQDGDLSDTQRMRSVHPQTAPKGTVRHGNGRSGKGTTQNRPKRHPIRSFFKGLLCVVVLLFCAYSAGALYLINKVDRVTFEERFTNPQGSLQSPTVKNVLLVGTDGRSDDDAGRSDSMVLLSIDVVNRRLTMTSFMRDIYVSIPNYGYGKLNSAYSHGGASLLLDTIEENFCITVDDCVTIDFESFMDIVDAIGGIDATVSDSEVEEINNVLMSEGNRIAGDDKMDGLLTSSGTVHLDGKQALTYSRIRYVGNADFERTERQRYVVSAILDTLKSNPLKVVSFADVTASEVTTSLDTLDLYGLSLLAPFVLGYDVVQQRIPADDTWYYDEADGQSILTVDFNQNYQYLSDTIYGD